MPIEYLNFQPIKIGVGGKVYLQIDDSNDSTFDQANNDLSISLKNNKLI